MKRVVSARLYIRKSKNRKDIIMSNSAKQIDKQIGLFYEIPRLISSVKTEENTDLTAEQAIGIMIVQRLDKVIELLQSKQPPD